MIFLGWKNGEFQTPKANKQLAPNGALSQGVDVYAVKVRSKRSVIVTLINVAHTSFTFTFRGFSTCPFILEKNTKMTGFFSLIMLFETLLKIFDTLFLVFYILE